MAKKKKETMELRVYEIPQGQLVLPLYGDAWKRIYGRENAELHFHNLMEIGVCRYGRGRITTIDTQYEYTDGTFTMFPASYPHTTYSYGDESNFWEYLFFDPKAIVQEMYQNSPIYANEVVKSLNSRRIIMDGEEGKRLTDIVNTIIDEAAKKERFHHMAMNKLMYLLIIELMRYFGNDTPYYSEGPAQTVNAVKISPAIDFVADNLEKPIKVSDLADACGLSEPHFRRIFDEYTDISPMDYVNLMRIQKACQLLTHSNESMEFVAEQCGFQNVSTFNRNFRKFLDTSPYQWKINPENYEGRLNQYHISPKQGW